MKKIIPLKEQFFNQIKVEKLAKEIKYVYKVFDEVGFERDVLKVFPTLELKERMYHIRDMLAKYLPIKYEEALDIILKALPLELDNNIEDDDFGDFIYAPYGEFIVYYGCNPKYLERSLSALEEITKRFSVEFAIRDFINLYPTQTLQMFQRCAVSTNYHQRRLVSEGLRPKLPWAKKLTLDYKETIPFLDKLFDDNTRYVTRSVANHLNDISKIDAPLVIETLKVWENTNRQNPKEMNYIINHSLRTLIKNANQEALEMLGYSFNPSINTSPLVLNTNQIKIGEELAFSFTIKAKEETALIIDYIIYFQSKLGKQNPKVFKFKKLTLAKDKTITLTKKHLFKANATTRRLHKGKHKIVLQINAKIYDGVEFILG